MRFLIALISFLLIVEYGVESAIAKVKKEKSEKKHPGKKKTSKRAICPRGLEDQDIATVFKGYSYTGFLKASSEGDVDLMNGLMRKPWGFYKGLDGIFYAVYAFKPESSEMAPFVDVDKLSVGKMVRINIPEYCALYTEVSPEEAGSSEHEPVGLLISRASAYKPKPLDPGGVKVERILEKIKKGIAEEDVDAGLDEENKTDESNDEGENEDKLTRSKEQENGSTVDSSEAKIFEKLNEPEEENTKEDTAEEEDLLQKDNDTTDDTESVTPDKETLDGAIINDKTDEKKDKEAPTEGEAGDESTSDEDLGTENEGG